MYDVSADFTFDSEFSDLPALPPESSVQQQATQQDDADPSSGSVPSEAQKEAQIEVGASRRGASAPVVVDSTARSRLPPADGGKQLSDVSQRPAIPTRRAAIGSSQELTEEEYEFLRFAFEHDLPLRLDQKNPKQRGTSTRVRYEKYKHAQRLRDVKRLGGSWGDIVWDFSRGFIDFSPSVASSASILELLEARRSRPISDAAAAFANVEGHVHVQDQFSALSFEESVQPTGKYREEYGLQTPTEP